jgi:hypothetical protein
MASPPAICRVSQPTSPRSQRSAFRSSIWTRRSHVNNRSYQLHHGPTSPTSKTPHPPPVLRTQRGRHRRGGAGQSAGRGWACGQRDAIPTQRLRPQGQTRDPALAGRRALTSGLVRLQAEPRKTPAPGIAGICEGKHPAFHHDGEPEGIPDPARPQAVPPIRQQRPLVVRVHPAHRQHRG